MKTNDFGCILFLSPTVVGSNFYLLLEPDPIFLTVDPQQLLWYTVSPRAIFILFYLFFTFHLVAGWIKTYSTHPTSLIYLLQSPCSQSKHGCFRRSKKSLISRRFDWNLCIDIFKNAFSSILQLLRSNFIMVSFIVFLF